MHDKKLKNALEKIQLALGRPCPIGRQRCRKNKKPSNRLDGQKTFAVAPDARRCAGMHGL